MAEKSRKSEVPLVPKWAYQRTALDVGPKIFYKAGRLGRWMKPARKRAARRRLVFLGALVAPEHVARLDELASRDDVSRSRTLRRVLDLGLAAITATQAAAR